jgi:hypothetical protein
MGVFVTQIISLAQPATSLKVIVAANRQESADFRVFYRLFKADSTEIQQSYVPFPGYDNLIDTDGDGFGDRVIDPSKNNGKPGCLCYTKRFGVYFQNINLVRTI